LEERLQEQHSDADQEPQIEDEPPSEER